MCAYDLDHQNSVMGCSTNQRLFCLRYPVVLDSCALPILDENITNTCRHQIEDVERGAGSASRTPHMHCLHHRQIFRAGVLRMYVRTYQYMKYYRLTDV